MLKCKKIWDALIEYAGIDSNTIYIYVSYFFCNRPEKVTDTFANIIIVDISAHTRISKIFSCRNNLDVFLQECKYEYGYKGSGWFSSTLSDTYQS